MSDPLENIMFMCRRPQTSIPKKSPWGPRWVQDKASFWCKNCQTDFSTLLRRHHCRHCGNVFCGHCSKTKRRIPKYGYVSKDVRCCTKCDALLGKSELLVAAVNSDDVQTATRLCNEGTDVSFSCEALPPLILAANRGSAELCRLFLRYGADVNHAGGLDSTVATDTEDEGLTALHACVRRDGHLGCMVILLDAEANVDVQTTKGLTPLMLAANGGHLECAKTLITHKAAVAKTDGEGETALHKAVRAGRADVVKLLVENGADPAIANHAGDTPRSLADQARRADLARFLEAD